MKALLESLLVPEGATWTYFYRRLEDTIPFNWHYHVEFELTLTVNSQGQRYVEGNIEPYEDGDLVLLGTNLPHTWMSQRKYDESEPHLAHVFWIRPDWIHTVIGTFVELTPLKVLLAKSNQGIVFSPATAKAVRSCVESMHTLSMSGRLTHFVEMLAILAQAQDYRLLCAPRMELVRDNLIDCPRIDIILKYIHAHYESAISMTHLADLAALSVSGLHRLFKRHTRLTVSEYIAQLRIGRACSLLISTTRPIARIAEDIGYGNLSHFNRQFFAIKQLTPRQFRGSYFQKQHELPPSFSDNNIISTCFMAKNEPLPSDKPSPTKSQRM